MVTPPHISAQDAGEPLDAEAMWREQVRRARAMTPEERLRDALHLSALARALMLAGVRAENPLADDAAVAARVRERIAIVRRLEARS